MTTFILVALLPTLLAFALRPQAPWYRVLLWGACVWPALIMAALSWLLAPLAVKSAIAVIPDAESLTATTRARLKSHPLILARRLPPWARWFMELRDDQLLPPGRYEPRMDEYRGDWQAQSIAMIRSNPANAFDHLIGMKVFVGIDRPYESGPRASDTVYGIWRGRVHNAWQIMGFIRLPGPRDLQFNIGYTIRDVFDNPDVEQPVHSARYRLPVVRFPVRQA